MAENQRIEDLRRRVQKDPASIAFAQLAEELRRAGQCQEAVDTCRAGLAIHPGYLSARVTLGRALIELNQLDEALAELQLVLKSAPENLAAIRGVAEIHHREGAFAEALHQYRNALALARNDPDLERTVTELSREVEPQKPAVPTDGLSFEQMRRELLKHAPPPPKHVAPPEEHVAAPEEHVAAPEEHVGQRAEHAPQRAEHTRQRAEELLQGASVQSVEDPTRERAMQIIAALEQWLDAIHVARTDRGA